MRWGREWTPSVEEPEPPKFKFPEEPVAHREGLWNFFIRLGLLIFNVMLVIGLLLFIYFYLKG